MNYDYAIKLGVLDAIGVDLGEELKNDAIDIEAEYIKIREKKSSLSRMQRDEVVFLFELIKEHNDKKAGAISDNSPGGSEEIHANPEV